MSDIHTHLHILTEQQEVRIIISPTQPNMTLHDVAAILENMATNLQQYPPDVTITEIKETLKNNEI